jgi:hypothetical protein
LEETFDGCRFSDHHAFLLAKMLDRVDALDALDADITEIGVDMTRFPTPAHLASWAKFSPIISESAGKRKGKNATGHGNRYLARVLGEAAVSAGRTDTFLGERYRRIGRRRDKKKAIVAVGRSILTVVWYLLSDPPVDFVLTRHRQDQPHPGSAALRREAAARLVTVIFEPVGGSRCPSGRLGPDVAGRHHASAPDRHRDRRGRGAPGGGRGGTAGTGGPASGLRQRTGHRRGLVAGLLT